MRAICEALGVSVNWDAVSRTVTVTGAGNTVILQIGSDTMSDFITNNGGKTWSYDSSLDTTVKLLQ